MQSRVLVLSLLLSSIPGGLAIAQEPPEQRIEALRVEIGELKALLKEMSKPMEGLDRRLRELEGAPPVPPPESNIRIWRWEPEGDLRFPTAVEKAMIPEGTLRPIRQRNERRFPPEPMRRPFDNILPPR